MTIPNLLLDIEKRPPQKAAATTASVTQEGRASPKAVQIRRVGELRTIKRLGIGVDASPFGNQVGQVLSKTSMLILQRQLTIVQAGQGWRCLERFVQPGLQIAVNKELLAQKSDQIRQ